MSVATLENQNLTLNQLIVNNSQYSDVSGYIPVSATLTSNATTTGLSVANIFATTEVSTPIVGISNSITPSNYVQLTCGSQNGLSVGQGSGTSASSGAVSCSNVFASAQVSAPTLGIPNATTPTNYVNLTCTSQNGLSVGQGSGAPASSGAISCSNVFASAGLSAPTVGIPNSTTPTSFINLACPSQNTLSIGQGGANGTLTCASIVLSANSQTGTLSINSTGGLTWNGILIS